MKKKVSVARPISSEFFFLAKGNKIWVENTSVKKYEDTKEEPYYLV
jgi:hypothetical protein